MAEANEIQNFARSKPLLTIAIPTYNRASLLRESLTVLSEQHAGDPRINFIVCDNASPDQTEACVQHFIDIGLPLRYLRNETNLGPDRNIHRCFEAADGRYVWVMGDDDLLVSGTLSVIVSLLAEAEARGGYHHVYLSSFPFSGTYVEPRPEALRDRFGRFAEVVNDGAYFLERVNALITLLSSNIVNKEMFLETEHPPLEELYGSFLVQLGWTLPLIQTRCRTLHIWEQMVAYRSFNTNGWGLTKVFGLNMKSISEKYYATSPKLARSLMNGTLRTWMPEQLLPAREGRHDASMEQESFIEVLKPEFGFNWRFWLWVYPILALPQKAASLYQRATTFLNQVLRVFGAARIYLKTSGRNLIARP
jgi:abequosyltransferase